jgi:homoserine dehydrogenase
MRLIIVGFGNVGRSFLEMVKGREEWLRMHYGFTPQVVAIVDRGGAMIKQTGIVLEKPVEARKFGGSVAFHEELGHKGMSALSVIESVDADVVLELTPTKMPDGEPALTHIESAIKKGLNVVTTNKGPLAVAMPALLELAQYERVHLRFSGTVGGGTPILNFAKSCLNGDKIESIQGILNGTTNYILTRMLDAEISMEKALDEAKKAGYAEADPSYDISGLDTASKLVIMCNWILRKKVSIKDVMLEGISKVSVQDIEKGKHSGKAVKLVGFADDSEISVKPRPIPLDSPLCVKGTLNAVEFKTEFAGDITLIGHGAGGKETASAVLRDIIDIKRMLLK